MGSGRGLTIERTGDTAVALLKAGAETDKKDIDGHLAMELAPDAQVSSSPPRTYLSLHSHPHT
jgi:26S proteasome non-ATPase regulatory subunit 10